MCGACVHALMASFLLCAALPEGMFVREPLLPTTRVGPYTSSIAGRNRSSCAFACMSHTNCTGFLFGPKALYMGDGCYLIVGPTLSGPSNVSSLLELWAMKNFGFSTVPLSPSLDTEGIPLPPLAAQTFTVPEHMHGTRLLSVALPIFRQTANCPVAPAADIHLCRNLTNAQVTSFSASKLSCTTFSTTLAGTTTMGPTLSLTPNMPLLTINISHDVAPLLAAKELWTIVVEVSTDETSGLCGLLWFGKHFNKTLVGTAERRIVRLQSIQNATQTSATTQFIGMVSESE
jgi:hypothetical protein